MNYMHVVVLDPNHPAHQGQGEIEPNKAVRHYKKIIQECTIQLESTLTTVRIVKKHAK